MTISEIAKLAGVSVSTVSKIMNGKDESIRAETREHVLQIAKEYNYKPYASIMTSYAAKSLCIGVILRTADSISLYAGSILEAAQKNGYSVIFRESCSSSENEKKNLSALINLHVDGILWEPVCEDFLSAAEQLESAGIPYLLFNSSSSQAQNLDFRKMGFTATEALIKAGHTDIACLLDHSEKACDFFLGYQQALFEHSLPLNDELTFYEEDGLPSGRLASRLFSGIIVFHNADAARLIREAEALHYSVPCDLSVVTLEADTQPFSCLSVSAVQIPYKAFARRITNLLIQTVEKRTLEPEALPDFHLNHTESIDIPYHSRIKKVISLGSINIDNYMSFKELPHTGKTVTSPASVTIPGGKCINETIGLSKLGHSACAIGCVGDDADADILYEYARNYLADTSGIKRCKGQKTGQAYIFVQEDGNSMISIMSGANNTLSGEYVSCCEYLFANASFCLMQTEVPVDALIRAAELSKKYGLTTVLKPSACSFLPPRLLQLTDILVPNLDELNEICPGEQSMEEKADYLLSCGIRTVIVTLGAQGCYIRSEELTCALPAIDVVSVDSSGAGDAFICALVSYLLYGYNLLSAAKIAGYAAGLSTTRQGTAAALVDRYTLETYIRRKEPDLL